MVRVTLFRKASKISFDDWLRFLEDLARANNYDIITMKSKLAESIRPASMVAPVR